MRWTADYSIRGSIVTAVALLFARPLSAQLPDDVGAGVNTGAVLSQFPQTATDAAMHRLLGLLLIVGVICMLWGIRKASK